MDKIEVTRPISKIESRRLATRTDATPVATDVAALVEAAKEAADIFDGMCDDEINEEFMPRLRQALAPFTKGQP